MDMCLEQTINKSQKSSSGIIGNTKKKDFVAQWELIHHELLSVCNLHRKLSLVSSENSELSLHHVFNRADITTMETKISDMINYINVHENPVHVANDCEKRLHNILTQEIMPTEISGQLLAIEAQGMALYVDFRNARFVSKTVRLSSTIHRHQLKTFKSIGIGRSVSQVERDTKKHLAEAQKIFDVANIRHYDIGDLFSYDLVPTNYLYDSSNLMRKPDKSELGRELN